MERTESQRNIIRRYLLKGNTITPLEALDMCGCFRLGAIIHVLRRHEGIEIVKDQPEAPEKPYARYWIEKGWLHRHFDEYKHYL